MFHAVMNSLLNLLPSERSDAAGLIVHSLVLLLVIVVGLCRSGKGKTGGDLK
jgi:hypothetical protein